MGLEKRQGKISASGTGRILGTLRVGLPEKMQHTSSILTVDK